MRCHHFSRSGKGKHTRSEKVTHPPSPKNKDGMSLVYTYTQTSTFAEPTLAERRAHPTARLAYYADIALKYERMIENGNPNEFAWWQLVAMCRACGMNTGNWCDHCEASGHTYQARWGQWFVGSPLCSVCENDEEVRCPTCGCRS